MKWIFGNKNMDKLWGDGGPYSQVQIDREIRILDDSVSREKYYIYANINPATIEVLKKSKDAIRNERILKVLDEAEYANKKEGYIWHVSGGEVEDLKELDYLAKMATDTIIEMHKLVMQFCKSHN